MCLVGLIALYGCVDFRLLIIFNIAWDGLVWVVDIEFCLNYDDCLVVVYCVMLD